MSEQDIFIEAMNRNDLSERRRFLDQACGEDHVLRARLEKLIQHSDHVGSFLEHPPEPLTLTAEAATDAVVIGTRIGTYKLLQQIGEGAFGVVFEAEQERPVRRRVALKVIKPGMDTREVIARFEAERQALAMMDHPNIAKVYDGGATGPASGCPGRPYFVMELVPGVPITDYCDQSNLTTRERLELFVTVCQAVQHAHQKGVIHRDLKPSNVLLAIQDGRPSPRIIDFGVAKAINQQLTERTLVTAFAQIVGTPLYMSPEQAELSPLGVDTRSDIYSLGALLYELLTGTTPFDKDRLKVASFDRLRQIICEEEPPRPSTRISTLAADRAVTIAEHRRTDAWRLGQTVRGELDWIVMKCLEKDRNRRYESAGSLARDVERYLNDEPVQACPPSASYRLSKFARRNKTLLAAGGAIAAALIVGLGLATWQYLRAATESARAKAVSDLLQEMLSSADENQAKGDKYTVRELLDDFSAGLGNQLADQPAAAADIHSTIGQAYSMLNLPTKAEPHFAKAVELRQQADGPEHESVAKARVSYAWILHDQKHYDDAESELRKSLEFYRQRGVTGEPVIHALSALQKVLFTIGRDDEARQLIDKARAIADSSGEGYYDLAIMLMRYANEQNKDGKFAEGEQLARESINMQRSLPGKQVLTGAHGLLTLSSALQSQRKFEEAEQAARESLAIFRRRYAPDHPNVRRATDQLKSILTSSGKQSVLESLAKEEAEEANRSDSPGYHVRLAKLLLTNRSRDSATSDVARQLIQRAIEEYGQLAADSPEDLERCLKAADGYAEVAKLCAAHPGFDQEIDNTYEGLTTALVGLLARFPESSRCREQVGHKYRQWAFALEFNSRHLSQAEQAFREAMTLFENLSNSNPDMRRIWFFLATTYVHLGDAHRRSGRPKDAEPVFRRAFEAYDQHAADIVEDSAADAWEMISDYFRLARLLPANNTPGDAQKDRGRQFIRRVMDAYGKSIADRSGNLDSRVTALNGYTWALGHCAATPGFEAEVDELNRRLEAELPKLVADFPDSSDCQWQAANLYRHWAVQLLCYSKYLSQSDRAIRESINFHEKLSQSNPKRPGVWLYMADRNIVLGYLNWLTTRPTEAEAAYRRAVDIYEQHESEETAADKTSGFASVINIDSGWLAYYLGCTHREDEAAKFIRKAVLSAKRLTDPAESADALYWTALVQVRLGDEAGYRETCKALVDVPISSTDDFTKVRTILTWCHAPAAIDNLHLAVERAEELAKHNSIDQRHVVPYVLGAALYRAGQYERAAAELEKSIAAYPNEPQLGDRIINWQKLFLAMTQWKLGQRDEARQLLSAIQPEIDKERQALSTLFHYRITLEILRREAEVLIGQKESEEIVENDNSLPVVPLNPGP